MNETVWETNGFKKLLLTEVTLFVLRFDVFQSLVYTCREGSYCYFFFFPFLKTKEKNILKLTVWWSPEGCFSVGRVWKQQHAMQVYALGNIGCCAEQCPALLGTNPCLPVTLQFPFCSAVFKSWKYDLCLLTPLWCCSALTTWWKSRTPPS